MIYERVASLLPSRALGWISEQLEYSGLGVSEQRFAGFVLAFGLGLSIAVALNAFVLFALPFLPTALIIFFVFSGGSFFWISSVAESKGKFVERVLPDALQLIASNIKAGLTTERALFVSARPEFGPLAEELKETSKRILSGERIERAVMEIPKRIKSKVLERTVWLIAEGIKSGGQIADLLIELSNDLREENALKAEIRANISMYVMLIFFSATIGAPILFAISSHIVGVLAEQTAAIGVSPSEIAAHGARIPVLGVIGIPKVGISEGFVVFFAQITLFFSCLFASLTLGVITTGNEKNGVKYIPITLAIAFALFFLTRGFVQQFFGKAIFLF